MATSPETPFIVPWVVFNSFHCTSWPVLWTLTASNTDLLSSTHADRCGAQTLGSRAKSCQSCLIEDIKIASFSLCSSAVSRFLGEALTVIGICFAWQSLFSDNLIFAKKIASSILPKHPSLLGVERLKFSRPRSISDQAIFNAMHSKAFRSSPQKCHERLHFGILAAPSASATRRRGALHWQL